MGLFDKKPKATIQDFCQQFYDSYVFQPIIAGQDMRWTYIDTVYDSIARIDPRFASVDRDLFRQEMMALRMELIGLAFMHSIRKDEFLLAQSLFTKDYLEKNNALDMWKTMLEYNQAISRSSVDIAKGERARRVTVIMSDSFRFETFKTYIKKFDRMDKECIARVCNRIACEVAWGKGVTAKYLMARLAERVGCDENMKPDALAAIVSVIQGFYQGAKEQIKSVSFV